IKCARFETDVFVIGRTTRPLQGRTFHDRSFPRVNRAGKTSEELSSFVTRSAGCGPRFQPRGSASAADDCAGLRLRNKCSDEHGVGQRKLIHTAELLETSRSRTISGKHDRAMDTAFP